MKKYYYIILILIFSVSCNKFLDREPLSEITPQSYFNDSDQLDSYIFGLYPDFFTTHKPYTVGNFALDDHTDNQAKSGANSIWAPGEVRVPATNGKWDFDKIYKVNYFLGEVLPKYNSGEIRGNAVDIKQSIGEAYFLRAMEYFDKLVSLGDFPIITTTNPDDKSKLIEISKRRPRNEVARFILSDLDKALDLLKGGSVSGKNRISKDAALLLRSRVALFEGTWLKYHQGTAFVPGGPDWPGSKMPYLSGFTIDINKEINFFLSEAMKSAEAIASSGSLTPSNHKTDGADVFSNPYFNMFADTDMSSYSDVILWRSYNASYVSHNTQAYLNLGGGTGFTRDFVDSFLMKNGLPIYSAMSGYQGDDYIKDVRANRDERLQLFMMKPGEVISTKGKKLKSDYPSIIDQSQYKSTTGYMNRKGLFLETKPMLTSNNPSVNGCLIFRKTEAYLNYIEAQYVRDGSLNSKSINYWKSLRKRAGLPADPNITISATDLSLERDWAKYSHGQLVDPILYNIRRERRCEFISEGMRMNDLKRWRSLDQVKNYQIEGFKLWGPMKEWYKNDKGEYTIKYQGGTPNVSAPSLSSYIRPYQVIKSNNKFYNGYNWTEAHYLDPISFEELQLASPDNNVDNSVIYQNPKWPKFAGGTPQ